jgi:hypothetical protein
MPNPDPTQPEPVEGDERLSSVRTGEDVQGSGTDASTEPAPGSLRDAEDTRGDENEGQFAVPVRPPEETQDGSGGF